MPHPLLLSVLLRWPQLTAVLLLSLLLLSLLLLSLLLSLLPR